MKRKAIRMYLLAAACAACLITGGCGSNSSNSRNQTAAIEAASEAMTEAGDLETAEAGLGLSEETICGIWGVDHILLNGSTYTLAELEAQNAYNLSNSYLVFKAGGSVYVQDGTDTKNGSWSISDPNVLAFGKTLPYATEDQTIAWDTDDYTAYFIRISESQDITDIPEWKSAPAESDDDSGKSADNSAASSGSSEVSPDFKETMDSYEAFFDEYAEFMQTYADSDDPMAMLGDYASMMATYADTMEKMDSIDTDSLSTADYAYYIEVTARIEKKLLEAY